MSTQLDWQVGGEDKGPPEQQQRRLPLSSLVTIAFLACAAILLGMVWWAGRERALQAEQLLLQEIQDRLDSQRAALLAGDGDLFSPTSLPMPTGACPTCGRSSYPSSVLD